MSKLGEIYKKADAMVQDAYATDPEDHWKLKAIDEHRNGIAKHDSVMSQFALQVEKVVDDILAAETSVPATVAPTVSPNVKKMNNTELPKTPDNPEGIDLGWN